MSLGICNRSPFNGSYVVFVVTIPLYIIFQLTLLGNTAYQHKLSNTTPIKRSLSLTYITAQLIALYFTIMELLRWVIDPHSTSMDIFCGIRAYSPTLINVTYYALYLLHILLRLPFNKYNFIFPFIALVPILCLIIVLSLPPHTQTCLWQWTPMDANTDNTDKFSVCAFQDYSKVNTIIVIGIGYAIFINVLFSVMFAVQFKKTFSKNEETNDKTMTMSTSLIIKYLILTCIGCAVTVLNYTLYFILYATNVYRTSDIGVVFHTYTDICTHTLLLALMFNYNGSYYKLFCKRCITHLNNSDTSEIEMSVQQSAIDLQPQYHSNGSNDIIMEQKQEQSEHTMDYNGSIEDSHGSNGTDIAPYKRPNLFINKASMDNIITELPFQITPLPVISEPDLDTHKRNDSMLQTLSDADIVSALKPLQKGVKRFIDGEADTWSPIEYKWKPDNSDILTPKQSKIATSPRVNSVKFKKNNVKKGKSMASIKKVKSMTNVSKGKYNPKNIKKGKSMANIKKGKSIASVKNVKSMAEINKSMKGKSLDKINKSKKTGANTLKKEKAKST